MSDDSYDLTEDFDSQCDTSDSDSSENVDFDSDQSSDVDVPPPRQRGRIPHGPKRISKDVQRMLHGPAAGVAELYQHDCPNESCPQRISEFATLDEEEENLYKRHADTPILHLHSHKKKKWVTEFFKIQCPIMRDILREALHKYQDLDMDLKEWVFAPPYRALIHRWDKLKEIQAGLTDEEKIQPAKTLVEFLTPVLAGSVESLSETRKTGKVNFRNVWQIFAPGVLAVTNLYGVETLCRVTKYEKKSLPNNRYCWLIHLEYVDWNGQRCGYSTSSKSISKFSGFKHIRSLPVYALEFDGAAEEKKAEMLKRGRRFESLRGYHFLTCNENGRKVVLDDCTANLKAVSGRIVIDSFAYFGANSSIRPKLRSLKEPAGEKPGPRKAPVKPKAANKPSVERTSQPKKKPVPGIMMPLPMVGGMQHPIPGMPLPMAGGMQHPIPGMPATRPAKLRSGLPPPPPPPPGHAAPLLGLAESAKLNDHELTSSDPEQAKSRKEDLTPLTDEQCMIATPWLRGMDMKTKEWGMFFVDELHDIVWNEQAFDNLVLPEEDKTLAWDFVEAKRLSNNAYDDFIADKGRGTIVLMFGPPGVGKTLTAEAVAEKSHVPLYSVSAGVLGSRSIDVEASLDQALDLCRLWNAILLLDEADVFLGARTNDGLIRNELVSIFLTKLEYYQGILFLTTNRIASIDHAFQSRVDLFLPYYDLDAVARQQVWRNFIEHVGARGFDVDEAGLERLAEIPLNGREIKNLIKTSQLLSLKAGTKVDVERLVILAEKRVKALGLLADHGKAYGCG